ncbi:hypothetical protein BpHYR1_018055 [Brachionus plicatilis]|uniref:Uncharacterized protein n=1 Tax=Brachionus plicatilis TaxID=10195 RepID=A0A3M7S3U8_BRAPC|nr:hypothetical protein BpHYR1_018055 [Brachionus plicatilis]
MFNLKFNWVVVTCIANNNIQSFEPIHSALNRFCCYLLKQFLKNLTNRNIASYLNWYKEGFNTLGKVSKCTIKIENLLYCLLKSQILEVKGYHQTQCLKISKLFEQKPKVNNFEANQDDSNQENDLDVSNDCL